MGRILQTYEDAGGYDGCRRELVDVLLRRPEHPALGGDDGAVEHPDGRREQHVVDVGAAPDCVQRRLEESRPLQPRPQPQAPQGEHGEGRGQQVQQPGVQVELQDDAQGQGHAQDRVAARGEVILVVLVRLSPSRLDATAPTASHLAPEACGGMGNKYRSSSRPTTAPIEVGAVTKGRTCGAGGVPEQQLAPSVGPDVPGGPPGRGLLRHRAPTPRAQEDAVVILHHL